MAGGRKRHIPTSEDEVVVLMMRTRVHVQA